MGMKKATVFVIVLLMMGSVIALGCIGGSGTSSSSSSTSTTSASSSATPATKTTATSSTTTTATTTTTAEHTQTERAYYPITIKDFANRTVTIEKEPRRVVTIAPSLTEDLYYLGLFDRVVGVTQFDDFPPGVANVTRIGGYGKYANLELIANLSPDLIIADSYSLSILDQLEKIAPVVIVDPHSINDIPKALDLLGRIFNVEDKAKEVSSQFEAQLEELSSAVSGFEKVKVFYVVWGDPLTTAGGDTFISDIIALAGGINIFNDTSGWPAVSMEQIIARDPDVIILTPHCGMKLDDAYQKFAAASAAKSGRVYMVENENDLIHPSPRVVRGLEILAKLLHPEAFREKYPMTITDFMNRTVTIPKEPQRIVSLAPSITETLFYIGAGDKLVGVTKWADWPPAVENISKIGGYGKYANLELIANLSPDLIIADSYSLSILDQLEKIAPVVIVDPKDINGIYRQIDLLGKVTNREEQAKLVIGEMKGEIAYIESKVRDLPRPEVFFILSYYKGYWTAGRGTFMDSVITLAGGRNIFNDTKGWVKVSDEQIIVRDPDVIVVLPTAGVNATELCNGPLSVTTAVKEGRVYTATDSNVYQRPSPRIVVAIEEMAEFLHPEAFGVSFNSTACAVSTS
ncbi:ABC transporter substrate-binding protein [Thermococcus gammatolerans]|nr:helical backbone metal receptor [Thermococcus gammatolerans]